MIVHTKESNEPLIKSAQRNFLLFLLFASTLIELMIYHHKDHKLHEALDCVQILSAVPYLTV